MKSIITIAIVGLGAQLVDGTLGMAYGVTSTTLLLTAGYSPAIASASVHLAEIGTTLASGASHWRFGNVNWKVVRNIGVPGAVGAFAGATFLSSLSTESAAPWMAGILLALGVYLLLRFATKVPTQKHEVPPRKRFLAPLGLFAGFIDATGGGGWGPVATPTLISSGGMSPRRVIGTVDTAEFLVAVAASIGFFIGIGSEQIPWEAVFGLLAGGLVAAPVAAYLVRHVPARMLGASVGGLIILTNTRTLLNAFDVGNSSRPGIYATIAVVWAMFLGLALKGLLADRREDRAAAAEDDRELAPTS